MLLWALGGTCLKIANNTLSLEFLHVASPLVDLSVLLVYIVSSGGAQVLLHVACCPPRGRVPIAAVIWR